MGLRGRIKRLEARPKAKRCSECRLPPDDPGYIVISDEGSSASREQEWCSRCGRPLYFIIEVVEDGSESSEPESIQWP